ncbi:unnamed protein product [Microthlaspi erraticum]|uniref:F-box associated beta-propeller type 3 domain-containing protein n=1 Tax=Microthlaspi erraticum TaxID=1685480 RepID=A0A6D2KI62_9BRAS|nr:unnamed protein product [Microthlaspi erraticum]
MTRARSGRNMCEQHQVLTLGGTGKLSWRMIKCSLHHFPLCDGICINGVLYYKAVVYGFEKRYGIVCFAIRSEKFEFIENQVLSTDMDKFAILKWDENFAMVRSKSFELCVLEDAKKHEWSTRTFVLPALCNDIAADAKLCLVGVIRRCEIVLSHSMDPFFLIYYNLERNTLTKIDIQGMDAVKHCIVHTFLDHVENVNLEGVFRTS